MPEKGTREEILELAGGKENYSMSPEAREEVAAAAAQVGQGKDVTGVGPVTTQQGGTAVTEETAEAAKGATPRATKGQLAPVQAMPFNAVVTSQTGTETIKPPVQQAADEGEVMTRLLTAMGYNSPETPEEKAKREKNEKWEKIFSAIGDGVSAMAGLYFAGQTGISNYSKENSMSAKTKARWDKLNADRLANARAYGDAYMRLKSMRDQDRHWREQMKMQQEQAKQQQANWQATFDYNKEKDQKAWDRLLANDAQAQENWQKTFEQREAQIQFQNEMTKKQYNLSRSSLARQSSGDKIDFLIGDNQKITVPKSSLNTANITYVYNTLPQSVRDQAHGAPVLNSMGMQVRDTNGQPVYNPLSSDEMLTVIFSNVTGNTATQNALKQLAGETTKPSDKPKLF